MLVREVGVDVGEGVYFFPKPSLRPPGSFRSSAVQLDQVGISVSRIASTPMLSQGIRGIGRIAAGPRVVLVQVGLVVVKNHEVPKLATERRVPSQWERLEVFEN